MYHHRERCRAVPASMAPTPALAGVPDVSIASLWLPYLIRLLEALRGVGSRNYLHACRRRPCGVAGSHARLKCQGGRSRRGMAGAWAAAFIAGQEWIVIVILAAILIFGAKKIPELAKTLGRSRGEYEKGKMEGERELAEFKGDGDGESPPKSDAAGERPKADVTSDKPGP